MLCIGKIVRGGEGIELATPHLRKDFTAIISPKSHSWMEMVESQAWDWA